MVLLCTIVVSGNRLHALCDTHDNHYANEHESVHDTIRTDGQVAVILFQPLVDENEDESRCYIHTERRKTDGYHVIHDLALQMLDASAQVEQFVLVGQNLELPD